MTKAQRQRAIRETQKAIKQVGGFSAVARLYDPPISREAVSQWTLVPANRIIALAEAAGVHPHKLNPDLFPAYMPFKAEAKTTDQSVCASAG